MHLLTWAHRAMFSYTGSVLSGTEIAYGAGSVSTTAATPCLIRVTAGQYRALLAAFAGARVAVGSSRDPRAGTLEYWLQENVTRTAAASYVAPILIYERYARRVVGNDTDIEFV